MASTFPQFQRLPEQIRSDIFQLAARGLRLVTQHPVPITRGKLTLFRNGYTNIADNIATHYALTIDRTRGQHEAYQPLLSLCSESRAETVGNEVFQLLMGTYDLPFKMCQHLLRTRLPGSSNPSIPAVPIFDGAVRDLILIPPPARTTWHNTAELLGALSRVFGTGLRRIYLQNEPPPHRMRYALMAEDTCWRYVFDRDFGGEGLDRLIEDIFPGLDKISVDDDLRQLEMLSARSELETEAARIFGFLRTPDSQTLPVKVRFGVHGKWEAKEAQDKCYGEVIRHYRGGKTMANKALKAGIKTISSSDCPTAHSQYLLEQLAQLAGKYFPNLESVSIPTLLRQVD